MQWRRIVGVGLLGATLAVGGWCGGFFTAQRLADRGIERHVDRTLIWTMRELEREFKFTFTGMPTVEYSTVLPGGKLGIYDPATDTIYLATAGGVTPGDSVANLLQKMFYIGKEVDVQQTLVHELGHVSLKQLREQQHISPIVTGRTPQEMIAKRLVDEGMAEHFRKRMYHEPNLFTDRDWPQSPEDWQQTYSHPEQIYFVRTFYEGGECLVRQILRTHGRRGMEYLIKNPPTNELLDLPGYRRRSLEALSRDKF